MLHSCLRFDGITQNLSFNCQYIAIYSNMDKFYSIYKKKIFSNNFENGRSLITQLAKYMNGIASAEYTNNNKTKKKYIRLIFDICHVVLQQWKGSNSQINNYFSRNSVLISI